MNPLTITFKYKNNPWPIPCENVWLRSYYDHTMMRCRTCLNTRWNQCKPHQRHTYGHNTQTPCSSNVYDHCTQAPGPPNVSDRWSSQQLLKCGDKSLPQVTGNPPDTSYIGSYLLKYSLSMLSARQHCLTVRHHVNVAVSHKHPSCVLVPGMLSDTYRGECFCHAGFASYKNLSRIKIVISAD